MLIDLTLLRIGLFGSRRLLQLTEMNGGVFTELKTGKQMSTQITVMDTNHHRILRLLRRMYLAVAYGS
jgi:hypothetical protein